MVVLWAYIHPSDLSNVQFAFLNIILSLLDDSQFFQASSFHVDVSVELISVLFDFKRVFLSIGLLPEQLLVVPGCL